MLGLKKPTLAIELMNAVLAYEFDEVPLRTEYGLPVFEHMGEMKHVTFFDSAYHVLVIRAKGLYLTTDAAYVKRAKAKGHVSLLSEWKGPVM